MYGMGERQTRRMHGFEPWTRHVSCRVEEGITHRPVVTNLAEFDDSPALHFILLVVAVHILCHSLACIHQALR